MKILPRNNMYIVVRDNGHPYLSTLKYYKRESINEFITGSQEPWRYWRDKWRFRCIKVDVTFTAK